MGGHREKEYRGTGDRSRRKRKAGGKWDVGKEGKCETNGEIG